MAISAERQKKIDANIKKNKATYKEAKASSSPVNYGSSNDSKTSSSPSGFEQRSEGYDGADKHSMKRNIPQKGVFTSKGHTWKDGVYQGQYDQAGDLTLATSQKKKTDTSRADQAEEMKRATQQGWAGGTYEDLEKSKYARTQDVGTQDVGTQDTGTQDTGTQNIPMYKEAPEVMGLPEGYDYKDGQLTIDGETATPQEQLEFAKFQSETGDIQRQFSEEERDSLNFLDDMRRFVERGQDYIEDTGDAAIQKLEDERDAAQAQAQFDKDELNYNLQNDLNSLRSQQASTKSEYINATVGLGGARFSTLASGKSSIDVKFAELQQRTKREAQLELRALGLQEDATSNYYSSKIADIRLNSQKEMADFTDKFQINTRDIILKMGDNKAQMSRDLYDAGLEYQGQIITMNQAQVKATQDAIMENMDLNIKGQKVADSTGQSYTVQMGGDAGFKTWTPKPKSTKEVVTKDPLAVGKLLNDNYEIYFKKGSDKDSEYTELNEAGRALIKSLTVEEQDKTFAEYNRLADLEEEGGWGFPKLENVDLSDPNALDLNPFK